MADVGVGDLFVEDNGDAVVLATVLSLGEKQICGLECSSSLKIILKQAADFISNVYGVIQQVSDFRWVDFDFGCSNVYLILLC